MLSRARSRWGSTPPPPPPPQAQLEEQARQQETRRGLELTVDPNVYFMTSPSDTNFSPTESLYYS